MDRRIRKTRAILKDGLAELLEKKNIRDIKVTELVKLIDINRSTFYLHYTDIFDMMEKIEMELMDEVNASFVKHPFDNKDNSILFISDIFTILNENRKICKALIGPNGDIAFVNKIENLVGVHAVDAIAPKLKETTKQEMLYTYAYCLSGCVGLIKTWLLTDATESPMEMAEIMYNMVKDNLSELYK